MGSVLLGGLVVFLPRSGALRLLGWCVCLYCVLRLHRRFQSCALVPSILGLRLFPASGYPGFLSLRVHHRGCKALLLCRNVR